MEVPATRPEVTTTGIYGEELNAVRQSLQHSDLCWFGDLTSRTQVLIVGTAACAASRKLSVARMRALPCVSIKWVTDGGCAMESTDRFDIAHWVTGKEVCTTGLHHLERERVQAVCCARHATYNALLTRHCGLLVASAAALAFTSQSASYPATLNDKVRFARRHSVPIITTEEFMLRYATDRLPHHHLPVEDAVSGQVVSDASTLKTSSGLRKTSSSNIETGVTSEMQSKVGSSSTVATAGYRAISNPNEVLVCSSIRPSALPGRSTTPTPRASLASCGHIISGTQGLRSTEEAWCGRDSIMPNSVQPSLSSSQLMPTSSNSVYASLQGLSHRTLADEFSDVVAYCSPPHRLTRQQRDMLIGMGVTLSPHLTPSTTHVVVLSEVVEECLYPRPGLQVVSWQWVSSSQLEQRRLSCLGFRVECVFRPVVTFTGLPPAERHALVSALQRSGLPAEVQEALVLCGGSGERSGSTSRRSAAPVRNPYLPCKTTHLVVPRSQLLSSPKVAMLAQHHYQHASPPQPHSSAPLPSTPACRLVGVDWVYRSIQQMQWLDADLFTLPIPTPEAFALAATAHSKYARAPPPHNRQAAQESLSVGPCTPRRSSASAMATSLSAQAPLPQPSSSLSQCSLLQNATRCDLNRGLERPAVADGAVEEGDEEEVEAASSQTRNTNVGHTTESASTSSPLHCTRDDDDDEEAGGESPLASDAVRSGLPAIHSTPRQSSSAPSQMSISASLATGKQDEVVTYANTDLAAALHHHADPPLSSTYLATQFSPSFENLLGELEAGPPGTLFGAFPANVPLRPHLPVRNTASAPALSTLAGSEKGERDRRAGSDAATPPLANADVCVERRALLCRPSAQPHMVRQQPQLMSRSMSDESQVIFYQMGFDEADGIAGAPPAASHDNPQAESEVGVSLTIADAAVPSVSGATGAAADAYPPSTSTSAVFLITKDVLKGGFDWDSFANCFPHAKRTTKPEECTHFITATLSKTEQFLCCLAAGRWVLTASYVTACMQARYLVSEEPFEWNAEMAAALGCRSSVALLARGCRVQREAPQLPFSSWRVRVCCINSARAESFLRVLRNGGCKSLEAATAAEVMAASNERGSASPFSTELVLADDTVFTEGELEELASRPASVGCPVMRLEYLVQFLCAADTPLSEMNLLHCVRSRKRSRTRTAVTE
ncbi:hypothetical protein JKF63_00495 [Porcisia hertigi]|uniref:BRCT domain-containing protein n=1 Tax=Porcisia hertigi TaxID=2761500 RepID=A0A836I8D1_9TRYP|nr:hypothetical protein JKF63_00495 [Porcisia hertigi]